MKKYYIIFGAVGAGFILCLATLLYNPDSNKLLTRRYFYPGETIHTSLAGDILLIIVGIILLIAVISIIAYSIYKFICKARKKKNFIPDASELYTDKQSSENISKWMISSRQGYLDKDENNDKNNFRKK